MPSRHILRLAWAQAARRTTRELGAFALLAIGFIAIAFVDPYQTARAGVDEPVDRVQRDRLTLRERLGYAVLLRAGYVTASYPTPLPTVPAPARDSEGDTRSHAQGAAELPDPDRIVVELQSHSDWKCLGWLPQSRAADGAAVETRNLAAAIVATEKYNRAPITRHFEAGLARIRLALDRRLPDYSLGAAQLRPSRARPLLVEELGGSPLSDEELLEVLRNDCQNVRLAGRYIADLVHRYQGLSTADDVVARTALAYSGGAITSVQGLRYVDAVAGAYALLNEVSYTEDDEAPLATNDSVITESGCVMFDIGAMIATDSLTLSRPVPKDSNQTRKRPLLAPGESPVAVYLWQGDPGPKSYIEHLGRRRGEWLLTSLVRRGYRRELISLATQTARGNIFNRCQSDADLPAAQALIEVKGGQRFAPRAP